MNGADVPLSNKQTYKQTNKEWMVYYKLRSEASLCYVLAPDTFAVGIDGAIGENVACALFGVSIGKLSCDRRIKVLRRKDAENLCRYMCQLSSNAPKHVY